MKNLHVAHIIISILSLLVPAMVQATEPPSSLSVGVRLSGVVLSEDGSPLQYATVALKGTTQGTTTDAEGRYELRVAPGEHCVEVSMLGYDAEQHTIVASKARAELNFELAESSTRIDEVVIKASGVEQMRRSPFNAVVVDAQSLANSSKNLSDALAKAPGLKLRESGGVGSDMAITVDGFTGKHVKIFIDGVPQEGVGGSFSLNNIPAGFAERIEVYRGVVPVGFGSDAIGGVVNIVTNKSRRRWFADASYSYGSFNTHRSNIHAGQTFENGVMWEVNAFQNYSDNNYRVEAAIEDFATGRIDKDNKISVERFNDRYRNEALVAKLGVVDKSWADRFVVGISYSQMAKQIQTGVRQDIVYGQKHRHGYSLIPSVEYLKRNIVVDGLDLTLTATYNHTATTNVDTAQYKYNWLGERHRLNSPGEQSYQHSRANNRNWSATATLNYRISKVHTITLNHVLNDFRRSTTSLLANEPESSAIDKHTMKNITGLQYRLRPSDRWNLSLFAKYYSVVATGPVATDANQSNFVEAMRRNSALGYGAAATWFVASELQAKLSYEKAYRLPSIEEMFGDEDLEMGDIGIRPENSDNLNLNVSYSVDLGAKHRHNLYVEGGFIFRNTNDYIQRNIVDLSGGKAAASYLNYGRVMTLGGSVSVRYTLAKWLSVGGNLSYMDVRDNQKIAIGTTSMPNLGYGDRMPNIPYMFADSDITFTWHDAIKSGDLLTITYDNQYLHSFYYYSSRIGANKDEFMIPKQFSHNLSIGYSLQGGRYNLSLECRNFSNERLYDNFSLQKAGRAYYVKLRVLFGGN